MSFPLLLDSNGWRAMPPISASYESVTLRNALGRVIPGTLTYAHIFIVQASMIMA